MTSHTVNVDPKEIEKFEASAKEWWDPKGPMAPLHHLNPARVQFMTDHANIVGKNLLDIGSGGGILTESLAKRGAHVTGIDACQRLIDEAIEHSAKQNLTINYQCNLAEAFAQDENNKHSFDVISCMELLEHVPDPISLVQAISQLLKPKGCAFFSTLNRNLKSYFFAILGAEYFMKILPKGTHQYEKFIKPAELSTILREAGLTVQKFAGLQYNPLTTKASLSEDVSINYLVYAIKDE